MDISDDKMNVYKDLARKCESFELFKWIVGDKESWMTEAGKAETETMLKTIYNGVHITDRQRLFVDMDGTLAEFKTVDTLETLYEKDYFINLNPNENVLGAIKQLIADNDFDVYILSAYLTDSRYALEEKNAWLDKYLPELPQEKRLFVPCGTDKSVAVPGLIRPDDYLLDDYTKNLSEWEPPAKGIKLINGINHTNGTWQGDKIQFTHAPEELSSMISDVMKGWTHFYEDRIVTDSVTMHSTKNDNRGEYDIEITEVLQKVVSTKAASLQEAIQDVEEQYHNSEIILDADDLKETTIEAAHPQLDEEITTDLRGIFL
ncbi:MAG: 5' nucleotidase, NT5C type [Lachnospira eligens]